MPNIDQTSNKPINTLDILIGITIGALVAYMLLRKNQTTALSTQTKHIQEIQDHSYIDTLYNQQNELSGQLKLLNELLIRQDQSSQQYYQTMTQQYQDIPYTITNTINPELQQIALYLENMNNQLEQTNYQLQQILKQQYQIKQSYIESNIKQSDQSNIKQSDQSNIKQSDQSNRQENFLEYIQRQLDHTSQPIRQQSKQQSRQDMEIQNNDSQISGQISSQKSSQTSANVAYKNNEKWAIKRGSDGRIKSLEIIRNALTKKQ